MPVSSPRRLMEGFICASSILSRSSILSVVHTILKRILGVDFLWKFLQYTPLVWNSIESEVMRVHNKIASR